MIPLLVRQQKERLWPYKVAHLLRDSISRVIHMQGKCSVMLTGGRAAQKIYSAWSEIGYADEMEGVTFYFGDERCVPLSDLENNYSMVLRTLFRKKVPSGCNIFRMEAEAENKEEACFKYGQSLPTSIDIMLLSVGEDGHIASIFPNSKVMKESKLLVTHVTGPKFPYERFTITPPVISRAKLIFLIAAGRGKGANLLKTLSSDSAPPGLPVMLVPNGIWMLDYPAMVNLLGKDN